MRSDFARLRYLTGLTYPECMDFLDVRLDTVKSWNSGRNKTPHGVLVQLAELYDHIESAAEMGLTDDEDLSHLPASSREIVRAMVLAWNMEVGE